MTTKPAKTRVAEKSQLKGWLVEVPTTGMRALMALRLSPRLEACAAEGVTWVRYLGAESDETASFGEEVRVALAGKLFHWSEGDEVVPWGCRVPIRALPEGPWVSLRELIAPTFPKSGFAMRGVEPCALTLVRSDELEEASVLCTTLAVWEAYVRRAAAIRLRRLSFVASREGMVLIFGTPLPQIEGELYWEREGLIVPAGWRWAPRIAAGLVREVLGLETGECAFWRDGEGSWERLKRSEFVAAQRRNVRQTVEELGGEADRAWGEA